VKIQLIMRELQISQDECIKGKAHIDQAMTEIRQLKDDMEQLQRSRKVLGELVD
jgi:hypothetical protein